MFGSSGIRGPWGEVSPQLGIRLGLALSVHRKKVLVGRDGRTTSRLLEEALVSGLLSGGAQVGRAGEVPTPALAYSTRRGFDAGVVVTASHNPPSDNGFKPWNPDGSAFQEEERREVERLLSHPPAPSTLPAPLDVGSTFELPDVVENHRSAILDRVGTLQRPLRVVLDCGNGVGALSTPDLLREMGAQVVTLNAHIDGNFPGRPSEPSEENLRDLSSLVVSLGAEVGLAHDGDADRLVAVDEKGRVVPGDVLVGILASQSGADCVVVPVDTSRGIDEVLRGKNIIRSRVGDAFVSEKIRETGAGFGGESSGALIFPEISLCPDGPHAASKLLSLVAREGPLSRWVESFPRLCTARASIPCPPHLFGEVLEKVERSFEGGTLTKLDGIRVDYPEGWILVRPSGTEPKIRYTVEAPDPKELERLKERVEGLLHRVLREIRS